ncbi:MAG: hypothetical protein KAH01_04870, partial [Caldisericia bacterium]|nr:hypothetical protein [Caldisericia bacterium]
DGRTAISHTNHVYLPDVDISVTDIENITSVDISSIQCYENEYVAEYNFHTDLEELTPLPWLILDNSEYTGNFAEPSALQSKLVWRTTATQY